MLKSDYLSAMHHARASLAGFERYIERNGYCFDIGQR